MQMDAVAIIEAVTLAVDVVMGVAIYRLGATTDRLNRAEDKRDERAKEQQKALDDAEQ